MAAGLHLDIGRRRVLDKDAGMGIVQESGLQERKDTTGSRWTDTLLLSKWVDS